MIGMVVGTIIGSYIPTLFGKLMFSYTSVFSSTIFGIIGIYIAFKLSEGL